MIPRHFHAALDAASAVALLAAAQGVPRDRPGLRAGLTAAGLGVAAYSLLTRYGKDGRAPLSMREHLALDAAQGAGFCLAAAHERNPLLRRMLGAYGAFSLAAAALTDRGPRVVPAPPQIPPPADALAPSSGRLAREVAPDLAWQRLGIVNVAFLGPRDAGDRGWLLVDAGLSGTGSFIEKAAAERFGPHARPRAIILTHGHFDHVGTLRRLARKWDVSVYAHRREHPFLIGQSAYPPGDPTVGGGVMAATGGLYPTAPVDISDRLLPLPEDNSVPHAPGWRWLHTPGHSPGHVSLWREHDRVVVAGDAVITTQEAALAVALLTPELHGPPAYFTTDWAAARQSAQKLAALNPDLLVAGHGAPMAGPLMRQALHLLAEEFDERAVPRGGRYLREPVRQQVERDDGRT